MDMPTGARTARLAVPFTALATLALGGPVAAQAQSPPATLDRADGDRVSARAPRHAVVGSVVPVRGTVASRTAGRRVLVELATPRGWRTVDRARTTAKGRFLARWRVRQPGSFRLRVRPIDASPAPGRRARRRLNVYRPGTASWYGPGLYGQRTACGRTLSPGLRGVAHKSLPCGTAVTFRYGRRTVTVPVVDRCPFVAGREWDLTAASKRALGFPSGGIVLSTR